jgi:hypothetical protein
MVGKHPARASPTIAFCSENELFREKAMKLVVKKILLEHHPGVLVAQSSKMPRPLAVSDSDWLANLPEGVYAEGPLETCGISIYIVAAGVSPRRATIGGFVSILGEYYGLTTAHAFTKSESTSPNGKSDVDFGFGELGEPDDSSDDEDYLLVKIGTLYATSSSKAGLDWALVKIDIRNFVSLTLDQDTLDQDGWTESACRKF